MLKKITTTTISGSIDSASGKKLLKVPTGEYAGRLISVFKTSNSDIKFSYADHPYSSWSSLTTIAVDSSQSVFDVDIDSVGNVHVIYCENTTEYLCCKKLTFSSGNWSVGSKVYIYNNGVCSSPSITIEDDNTLWISYSLYNTFYSLNLKSSTDGGATWGSGPTDVGEIIKINTTAVHSKVSLSSTHVYIFYTANTTDIFFIKRLLSGGNWDSEFVIGSGNNLDEHFDAVVKPEGMFAVVYDDDQLHYREFDGSNWGAITVLDINTCEYPQISFINNIPVIVFTTALGTDQKLIKYTHRLTGTFSTSQILDSRSDVFDQLIIYDSVSQTYSDLTNAASDSSTADVYHPTSNALIENSGDIVYLGMDQKFRFLKSLLSTTGVGGTVVFSYFDGSNWKSFTPASGAFNFDSLDQDVILWEDFLTTPIDWQKNQINGYTRFWVRIETTSQFSTPPIGTMLTAVSNITGINLRR